MLGELSHILLSLFQVLGELSLLLHELLFDLITIILQRVLLSVDDLFNLIDLLVSVQDRLNVVILRSVVLVLEEHDKPLDHVGVLSFEAMFVFEFDLLELVLELNQHLGLLSLLSSLLLDRLDL
jgi:hypothetical protein